MGTYNVISVHDREILKRFEYGAMIESEEEKRVLDQWSKVGFVTKDGKHSFASLTDSGRKHLNR